MDQYLIKDQAIEMRMPVPLREVHKPIGDFTFVADHLRSDPSFDLMTDFFRSALERLPRRSRILLSEIILSLLYTKNDPLTSCGRTFSQMGVLKAINANPNNHHDLYAKVPSPSGYGPPFYRFVRTIPVRQSEIAQPFADLVKHKAVLPADLSKKRKLFRVTNPLLEIWLRIDSQHGTREEANTLLQKRLSDFLKEGMAIPVAPQASYSQMVPYKPNWLINPQGTFPAQPSG